MAINWPRDVNYKPLAPYSPNHEYPVKEEENDVGLPTRIRTGSVPIISHEFGLVFTWEEWRKVEQWVENDLYCGVLSFYFTPPFSDLVKTGRFQMDEGKWYSSAETSNLGIKISVTIIETNEPISEGK